MRTDAAKGGCAMAIELSSGQTLSLRAASRVRMGLAELPPAVTALVFTVNSYSGQPFSAVDRASCRLVDETAGDEELASFSLTALGPHTAQIMAKLTRGGPAGR